MSLTNVLREHLYRRHACVRCLRCGRSFRTDDDLLPHSRSTSACEVGSVAPNPDDGFEKQRENLLRRRCKATATTEELWRQVYKILFPDDDEESTPSPCSYASALWPQCMADTVQIIGTTERSSMSSHDSKCFLDAKLLGNWKEDSTASFTVVPRRTLPISPGDCRAWSTRSRLRPSGHTSDRSPHRKAVQQVDWLQKALQLRLRRVQ